MEYSFVKLCSCGCKIEGRKRTDDVISVECPDCMREHHIKPAPGQAPNIGLKLCRCGRKPVMTAPLAGTDREYQVACECGRRGEQSGTTFGAVQEWNNSPVVGCGELASFRASGVDPEGPLIKTVRTKMPVMPSGDEEL